MRSYTCAACGETYESDRKAGEAEAETLRLWGRIPESQKMVICDDCFRRGMSQDIAVATLEETDPGEVLERIAESIAADLGFELDRESFRLARKQLKGG